MVVRGRRVRRGSIVVDVVFGVVFVLVAVVVVMLVWDESAGCFGGFGLIQWG